MFAVYQVGYSIYGVGLTKEKAMLQAKKQHSKIAHQGMDANNDIDDCKEIGDQINHLDFVLAPCTEELYQMILNDTNLSTNPSYELVNDILELT